MAQPPDSPPESLLLAQFKGVKNIVSRERLAPDEWERGLNVDLDDAGQPHRRRGYKLKSAGSFHSLFNVSSGILGVKDGVLGWINPDYTFKSTSYFVGEDPLSYVELGSDIYLSSRSASGILKPDNSVSPWGQVGGDGIWHSPVVNPTATLPPVKGKLLGAPPLAEYIAYLNGRIYLASGQTIWATELYLYTLVDKTKNFIQFESDITFLGVVTDGLYVGTMTGVWFLSGPFAQMKRQLVTTARGITGSLVQILAETTAPQTPQPISLKQGVLFMTTEGVCVGYDSGLSYNLTQKNMEFPNAQSAAALFRKMDGATNYVGVVNVGGTPASNARIGDYVDAEIRRFQGA